MFVAIHSNNETRTSRIIATGELGEVIERSKHYMDSVWYASHKIEELPALTSGVSGAAIWSEFAVHAFADGFATATIAVHDVESVDPRLLAILEFDDKGDDFSAI